MAQGWGPSTTEPTPAKPANPRPFWKHGWFIAIVSFVVGVALGASGNGSEPEPARVVTVTSIVVRTVEVPASTDEPTTAATPKTTLPPTTAAAKAATFSDGVYEVGAEIKPGTYKTGGGNGNDCYWARHKTLEDILDNNLSSGPMTLIVKQTDRFIEFNGGCEWRRV